MITFGIITNKSHHGATDQDYRLESILDSIYAENIPNQEIIIVGDYHTDRAKCIDFDESIKAGWITKKKNIITQNATQNIIVFLHDYILLYPGWFNGLIKFGLDHWDIMMTPIINKDGTRFRDWCVFKYDGNQGANGIWWHQTANHKPVLISPYLPAYTYNQTQYMYISGSYWIAKKHVMLEEPLDEQFVWGEPEDIEWSERVIPKYKYVMNTNAAVKLLHQKDRVWSPIQHYYGTANYIGEFINDINV